MRQPAHGGNLVWAAALAGCSPSAILDFSASINPLGPPNCALAAINSQLDNLRHYPDPDYSELRLTLSHFHQIPPEWILPGNGSAELLTLVGRELAELAATVLMTPAFGDYYRALAAYDAKVLEFPIVLQEQDNQEVLGIRDFMQGGSKQDLSELGEMRREFSPSSLLPSPFPLPSQSKSYGLLLNNPHNPTGKLFSLEAILPYLEEFALVVVDEAFMDFLPPTEEQSLIVVLEKYPNLVILRSLTKFYSLPGLRLGYALAHPDRLRRWQLWRDPWPVNTLAAAAAIAALQDREFQAQTWAWLPPTRNQLVLGLASIDGFQPQTSAANYLLVKSPQPSVWLQQQLLQHHQILIRDCQSFSELGERYFRVAVRKSEDNQRLLQAISSVISH
jgi:L-threonine-O-3-phosphate decarboxylase